MPFYQAAEAIIDTQLPLIPIYHYASVSMLNDAIKNWPDQNVQQNWYSKNLYRIEQ